jgi:hypothetical protein
MLWTIIIVLLVFWTAGVLTAVTLGGFIHLLLLCAYMVLLVQLIVQMGSGRRMV